MYLNSSSVIDMRCAYSGYVLYLSNSTFHSSVVIGGTSMCGFQSVMLSPDFVRRVTPPMWTIATTRPEVDSIHLPTGA